MPVQININGSDAAEAVKELASLASHLVGAQAFVTAAAPVAAAAETTAKPEKQSRRTKSEPAKEDPAQQEDPVKPEAAEEQEPADQPESEDAGSTDPVPTVVELRAKAQEVGTTPEAKKAIKALLDEFGSKSISDVSEGKRAEFLKRLEELA